MTALALQIVSDPRMGPGSGRKRRRRDLAMTGGAAIRTMRAVRAPGWRQVFARAAHPCAHPDCPIMLPAGAPGRCSQHGGADKKVRTGKPRGGWNWTRQRDKAVKRDGGRCQLCGSNEHPRVHHRVPLAQGGSDDLDNLVTLCWRCHDDLHSVVQREDPGIGPLSWGRGAARGEQSRSLRFPKSGGEG